MKVSSRVVSEIYCTHARTCKPRPRNTPQSDVKCNWLISLLSPSGLKMSSVNSDPLDRVIDDDGPCKHFGKIADSMREWEGPIAEQLDLTTPDIAAIRLKYQANLPLQA